MRPLTWRPVEPGGCSVGDPVTFEVTDDQFHDLYRRYTGLLNRERDSLWRGEVREVVFMLDLYAQMGPVVEHEQPVVAQTDALASVEALEARGFRIPQGVKRDMEVGQLRIDQPGALGPEPVLASPDPAAARAATQEAIERVDRAADPDWKAAAQNAVRLVAARQEIFTPDDIWTLVVKPSEPRALGPVMLRAKRDGICEPTGQLVKSKMATQHQNVITEYRSLIYRQEERHA